MLHNKNTIGGRSRRGIVAVCTAVMLIVVLTSLALAVDGGLLLDNRRRVQGAADAAALAAATELFKHYPAIVASNYQTADPSGAAADAATASALNNGFNNDGTTSIVEVHVPPSTGAFTGKVGYAEVIVTVNQSRYFSAIWSSANTAVKARAVARGRWAGSGKGIIVLDPSVKDSLDASGTGSVTVTGGAAVIVDSNNAEAGRVTGGGGLKANEFDLTGGYTGPFDGTVYTGVPPTPDPLRYLPVPSVPANGDVRQTGIGQGNKRYTLYPGRHNNLPNFNQGDEVVFMQASAGGDGIYYIDGGGFKSTGATISMDTSTTGGIMIYNAPNGTQSSQAVNITGNADGSVNLSALTSGKYAGILMWQDRTSPVAMSISGNGSFSLTGTFYVANAQLGVQGNGTATIGSQYISRTLSLSGNGNVLINYTDQGTARIREVILVE